MKAQTTKWFTSGEPWVWLNAAALSLSLIMVLSLLLLIAVNGLGHFWPEVLMEAELTQSQENGDSARIRIIGERTETEVIPTEPFAASSQTSDGLPLKRVLIKIANREQNRLDFVWIPEQHLSQINYPRELLILERREWGDLYGRLLSVKEDGKQIASGANAIEVLQYRLERNSQLIEQVEEIKSVEIGAINYQLEELRLHEKKLSLNKKNSSHLLLQERAVIREKRHELEASYAMLLIRLKQLEKQLQRDTAIIQISNGQEVSVPLEKIVLAYQPNAMNGLQKVSHYFKQIGRFLTDDPREANTEGGVFPAIFGTIIMVIIMSIMVTPLGVIAGVYLHEYAKQGMLTRIVRIAVNNLAGVPSIVYGVFGLGFFVYFLGGSLDALFYPEASPAPVFGTPGLLWASMTLAILTLPVVVVSTEEGLARIPKSIREGSLALGATKAETLWRTILPMASPAMMTGLILAVARAAGEVAPLMLVGVVKLAPSLAIDGNAPFLHLERKFMHLGFHVYDVALQSPNVEAARPLVFATALLLVLVIVLLNITAIALRNHLREKYKGLED